MPNYNKQAELFNVLSNPKRLQILDFLKNGPKTVNEIAEACNLRKSNISQNLQLMRLTGVLTAERKGKNVIYEIKDTNILKLLSI